MQEDREGRGRHLIHLIHRYLIHLIQNPANSNEYRLLKDASFNVSIIHDINTCILLSSNLVPRARVTLSSGTSFLVPLDKGNASSGTIA